MIVDTIQLQYFSIRKHSTQFSQITHDFLRVRIRHMEQSSRKDIVAHKYSHLVIISSIHTRLTSSLSTLVHHIIMNKRSRMKQFQSHSRMLSNCSYLTKILGHQQDEHRAHTLARTLSNMIERLREKTIAMHQRLVEQVYKISQFRLYRLLDK